MDGDWDSVSLDVVILVEICDALVDEDIRENDLEEVLLVFNIDEVKRLFHRTIAIQLKLLPQKWNVNDFIKFILLC